MPLSAFQPCNMGQYLTLHITATTDLTGRPRRRIACVPVGCEFGARRLFTSVNERKIVRDEPVAVLLTRSGR